MKIKTITCHDVYNVGASLQAYALQTYLKNQGHDVEIIDYKPDYLSKHYSLFVVNNFRYDKPFLRELYLFAKLPERVMALLSKKKKNFDSFKKEYLQITKKRYFSNTMLKEECPVADCYIAGSDQIWNPVFENGNDPAFYLDFVPNEKKCISYAASFAVESIPAENVRQTQEWLRKLDAIAVRESSGVEIVKKLGYEAQLVADPVFLLNKEEWLNISPKVYHSKNIFVYDFDGNDLLVQIASMISEKRKCEIHIAFPMDISGKLLKGMGPKEFLNEVRNAEMVISNSFHATAFSLIFHIDFIVMNREEKINSRMKDLLAWVGLQDRLISSLEEIKTIRRIDWENVDERIALLVRNSKEYLKKQVGE